jgi:hypothetical protein
MTPAHVSSLERHTFSLESTAATFGTIVSIDFSALLRSRGSMLAAADLVQEVAESLALALQEDILVFRQFILLPGFLTPRQRNLVERRLREGLGSVDWSVAGFDLGVGGNLEADLWAGLVAARRARDLGLRWTSTSAVFADAGGLPVRFLATPPPILSAGREASAHRVYDIVRAHFSSGHTQIVLLDFVGYNSEANFNSGTAGYGLVQRLAESIGDLTPQTLADLARRESIWAIRAHHQRVLKAATRNLAHLGRTQGALEIFTSACNGVGNDGVALACHPDSALGVAESIARRSSDLGFPCATVVVDGFPDVDRACRQGEMCLAAIKSRLGEARRRYSSVPCLSCTGSQPPEADTYARKQRLLFQGCPFLTS